ncbi:GNAT family N-acetyltransferase, partial [Yoonia sp.]|uniref:GNAT family N-acetyltransferase n=1 Tax=Yoonia sp. TaxID=2212373 RepID=UPI0039196341
YIAEMRLDDAALARAHPKWRASWRKAQARDCTIRSAPWDNENHRWLLQADLAQQRRAGFCALPHALIPAFAATGRNAAVVYTAHLDNILIAAMLFLRHAPVVTYHLGWTSDLGRDCGAHHRMLIHAAQDFHAQGCGRLDLGTIDTHHAPGLARFKIGSGAQIRQLGGTWIRLPGL